MTKPFDHPMVLTTHKANDFLAPTGLPRTIDSLLLFRNSIPDTVAKLLATEISVGTWGFAWRDLFCNTLGRALGGYLEELSPQEDFAKALSGRYRKALFEEFCELWDDFNSRTTKATEVPEALVAESPVDPEAIIDESYLQFLMSCVMYPTASPERGMLLEVYSRKTTTISDFYLNLKDVLKSIGLVSIANDDAVTLCWLDNRISKDIFWSVFGAEGTTVTGNTITNPTIKAFFRHYLGKDTTVEALTVPTNFRKLFC